MTEKYHAAIARASAIAAAESNRFFDLEDYEWANVWDEQAKQDMTTV